MDINSFVADVMAADAAFEIAANANFASQTETLGSNIAASDAATLSSWQTSYGSVIASCISNITTQVTNYYTDVIVPAKNAQVTFYLAQFRARNAQLVAQFALIRPPADVARITARLESVAVASAAAYDTQQTAIINTKRDDVLARAADSSKQTNLMQSFTDQFNQVSQNAVAAFIADLIQRNQIFHDVLALGDSQFTTDLLNTLNTSDPPLTLVQANAIVTTRNADRDQIITWRIDLLNTIYNQVNTTRSTQNTALIARFNSFDVCNYSMNGKNIAGYYAE